MAEISKSISILIFQGRIMNRVTKDLRSIDVDLPERNYESISVYTQTLGTIVVVVIANYYIIAPTLVVLLGFYAAHYFYINTTRDLKRLEALCKFRLQ